VEKPLSLLIYAYMVSSRQDSLSILNVFLFVAKIVSSRVVDTVVSSKDIGKIKSAVTFHASVRFSINERILSRVTAQVDNIICLLRNEQILMLKKCERIQ